MKSLTTLLTLLTLLATGLPAFAQGEHHAKDHEKRLEKIREIAIGGEPCRVLKVSGDGDVQFFGLGSQGYLGVQITTLTPELCAHFGVDAEKAVMVSKVEDDSPALRAGLAVGDVITRVNGEDVGSANQLSLLIRRHDENDTVDLEYWRDGKVATATAALETRERCGFDLGGLLELKELEHLPNFEWQGMDEDVAKRLRERFNFSGEAMGEAMERLHEVFEPRMLKEHLEHVEKIDVEKIEKRMEEVQKRLERLEKELQVEREKLDKEGGDETL